MEMKDERELREPYSVFMESHAMMRNHRKLRREIYISRIIIFILLITCTTFCALLYIQQFRGSKQNNENLIKKKENESHQEYHYGNEQVDEADVVTPLMASLSIIHKHVSKNANLTWNSYHIQMSDFCKNSCTPLIIPQEGIYRLSLQLTYCQFDRDEQQLNLSHKIVRYTKLGGTLTILTVYETVYKEKDWCKSVFSEVSYVFSEGDEVMVESNNANLLSIDGDWSTKNLFSIQFISKIKEE